MNVLIIEDEARAANRLERLIKAIKPEYHVIGKPESVKEAVNILASRQDIQLIFSDIELGDGTSFEIFRLTKTDIPIIFTTAFSQYAIDAFKVNGVDYLLKPIQEKELRQAIDKFSRTINAQSTQNRLQSLANAMEALQTKSHKKRFLVKIGTMLKSIPTGEIAAFYSEAKSSYLLTKTGRSYPVDISLDNIFSGLDSNTFFKISRKHIVSIDAVEDIHIYNNSRLILAIKGLEKQSVVVAREKVKGFKEWLG